MPTPLDTIVTLPDGTQRKVVPRSQLYFGAHGRTFCYPGHLKSMRHFAAAPVQVFDYSKGEKLVFPLDGNNKYGDCYYAAVAHASQCFTGNSGIECDFDANALVQRYLKIAGGDNGLDDRTIMPEWKAGIVGPNGPRRILDEMTVDVNDVASCVDGAWACGGLIWTCSLIPQWIDNAAPGSIWGADGRPNPAYGHAMFLSGRRASSNWDVRTWGISPPIQVTPAGIAATDSELIVVFSLDHFNKDGICVFTGMTYDQKAAWWVQRGGQNLPPSPFGPPPIVPPVPPPLPPPLPPVPPMPPTPTPPPIPGFLKPIVDWLFTALETAAAGNLIELAAIKMVHSWFDSLFAGNSALANTNVTSVSQLQQLVDTQFDTWIAAASFAWEKILLQDAKGIVDSFIGAAGPSLTAAPASFKMTFKKAA